MSGQEARVTAVLRSADRAAAQRVQHVGTRAVRVVSEAMDTAAALHIDTRAEESIVAVSAANVLWAIGRKWSGPVDEHGVLATHLDVLESAIATLREVSRGS